MNEEQRLKAAERYAMAQSANGWNAADHDFAKQDFLAGADWERKRRNQKVIEWKREKRKDPAFRAAENARARELRHTEEYRAKRRAAYAAKHANDPMTPHRAKCIAAMREVVKTPIEERRAYKQFLIDRRKDESCTSF